MASDTISPAKTVTGANTTEIINEQVKTAQVINKLTIL